MQWSNVFPKWNAVSLNEPVYLGTYCDRDRSTQNFIFHLNVGMETVSRLVTPLSTYL